jgi:hypothetical protein
MSSPEPSIQQRLADPFDPQAVKFKPNSVKGDKALCFAYVDARMIQDRLDAVVGLGNWNDDYEVLNDGCVICRLTLWIDGEGITKADVGSPSEQPDAGDRLKASFSDALKRAAIKFGIGRYLYSVANGWFDYDVQRKRFTDGAFTAMRGKLPRPRFAPAASASAARPPAAPTPPQTAQPASNVYNQTSPPPAAVAAAKQATGLEVMERLRVAEERFVAAGKIKEHDLRRAVYLAVAKQFNYGGTAEDWTHEMVVAAIEFGKAELALLAGR